MMRDPKSNTSVIHIFDTKAHSTTNEIVVSDVIDLSGFESNLFLINHGTNTGITSGKSITFTIEESNTLNNSDFSISTNIDYTGYIVFDVTNAGQKGTSGLSYKGSRRYIRLKVITVSTPRLTYSVSLILGHPKIGPATQQFTLLST